MKQYLVIHRCEDAPSAEWMTAEQVSGFLAENPDYKALTEVPGDMFSRFPAYSYVIIKGEVVVPEPVDVVKEWRWRLP